MLVPCNWPNVGMHWVVVDWDCDHRANVGVSQAACAHILVSPTLPPSGWPHVTHVHVHYEVNKNANCKCWDRTPGLEIINPALYQYRHPNQKPKGTLHCAIELH